MSNFLWVITKERAKLLKEVNKIPEAGKMNMSQIVEWALSELVKKHGKSQNPQTLIDLFSNPSILAVPNLYADSDDWIKFYNLVKSYPEFEELDKQLKMIQRVHDSMRTNNLVHN